MAYDIALIYNFQMKFRTGLLPVSSGLFLFIDRPENRDSEHVQNISNQHDVASRNTDLQQQQNQKPYMYIFFFLRCDPSRVKASSFLRFLDQTQRRTTVGRTPLDEWSARRRDLYLTKHNTNNRQTSMPPVGFEPTISAGERPQTYALDRVATPPVQLYYKNSTSHHLLRIINVGGILGTDSYHRS